MRELISKSCRFVVVVVAMMLSRAAWAQAVIETPAPSPKARVEQRVGITDLSIDYSSPGVKGRKIWARWCRTTRCGAPARTRRPS